MEKTVSRQSGIELLRIILMLMVITLHFNNPEMGGAMGISNLKLNNYFLRLFDSLSMCAVNCFMIISGYFLAYNKKVKLGKILDLLLIVIFYRVIEYLISIPLLGEVFSFKSFLFRFLPTNYFAIFYIVTYLFSPFITKIFDSISVKYQKFFVFCIVILFVVYTSILDLGKDLIPELWLEGISVISTSGSLAGYTIVQFFVTLIVGMYIKRTNFNTNTAILILVYFVSSFIISLLSVRFPSVTSYCSVFTVLNAVSLFLLFNKLKFKSKIINYISKSVFAIFCIHTLPLPLLMWKVFFITPQHINSSTLTMVSWFVISILGMFLMCLMIDIIVRNSVGRLKDSICNKCPEILNLEE